MDEPVAAVLFDLDDTLCRYRRDPGTVLSAAFERAGVDPLFPVEAYYDRFHEFADGAADMDELRERCFVALARERGHDPGIGRAVAEAFSAERDPAAVDPLPGACEAVAGLGERYPLGLVTNGLREAQRTKLRAVGLDDAFGVEVFAAESDRAAKPDPAPFRHACEALGVSPGEAIHVGDSPVADVGGATAAGLRSVLVAGSPAPSGPEPTYRVASPRELLPAPWER